MEKMKRMYEMYMGLRKRNTSVELVFEDGLLVIKQQ